MKINIYIYIYILIYTKKVQENDRKYTIFVGSLLHAIINYTVITKALHKLRLY